MKSLIRNISFLVLLSLGFSSCIFENYPDVEDGQGSDIDPNSTILFLDVRALKPSTSTAPAEKIKSVRVIIIGSSELDTDPGNEGAEEGMAQIVECNRLYEYPTVYASDFSYTLTWASNLGRKSVYVLANEASVSADLTQTLNEYEEMDSAAGLEETLADFSFTPAYDTSGSSIYLPYSYSKTDFLPVAGQVNPINCWLVPVATKFVFYFENKRDNAVNVKGISMANVNSASYLLAAIAREALYMEYGGNSLYWPDWLAAVSQQSWNYPEFGENEGFNQLYGWITDYSVPRPSDSHVFTFIDDKEWFAVPAASEVTTEDGNETVPGSYTTKIFYLPESINFVNPGADSSDADTDADEQYGEQSYYLTINLEDTGSGKAPAFENVLIPNLNSLFRNTFVVIKMVMGQGEIEIYAEIADWNMKTANGWVSEGSAPGNNPFEKK